MSQQVKATMGGRNSYYVFFHDSRGSFVTCPAHCRLDLSIPELNEGNIRKTSQHVLPPVDLSIIIIIHCKSVGYSAVAT
jgi:hypothetical protein